MEFEVPFLSIPGAGTCFYTIDGKETNRVEHLQKTQLCIQFTRYCFVIQYLHIVL